MKKWIKVIAICLCFVFVMQCISTEQYQYIAMEDVLMSEDIDVEFTENQIESIQQYRSLLNGFNNEAKMRCIEGQIYDENYGKDGIVISGHTVEYIDQIFFYKNTPVGAMVYKYGQKTNLTGGVIVSNYHTSVYDEDWNDEADHWVQNQTTAEYYSEDGDSGGPVFLIEGMYNGKYTCKLLGIHCGSYSGNAVFTKYYKIVDALNVQAKTY